MSWRNNPRSKAQPGDLRSRYWRSEGAQVDFDPTLPYTHRMSLREKLLRDPDKFEAASFRRFLPRYRKWQAEFSAPWKVPT